MACTSDRDPNALPIRGSNDLVRWRLIAYVFPAGRYPDWAVAPPGGVYWGPDIHRIANRWVIYFAAETTPTATAARTLALGVAWSSNTSGPWQSKLLHYGQFNFMAPNHIGGVIDPSEAVNPHTGQRYLAWAEEKDTLWSATLSSDGLRITSQPHLILTGDPHSWEYDPTTQSITVEGPSLYYHNRRWYLFYSGADTWNATYSLGAAVSSNPLEPFTRLGGDPILRSSRTWLGPGGAQNPVVGPDGKHYLFYHAARAVNPQYVSEKRMLLVSPFRWRGYMPVIGNGHAGS